MKHDLVRPAFRSAVCRTSAASSKWIPRFLLSVALCSVFLPASTLCAAPNPGEPATFRSEFKSQTLLPLITRSAQISNPFRLLPFAFILSEVTPVNIGYRARCYRDHPLQPFAFILQPSETAYPKPELPSPKPELPSPNPELSSPNVGISAPFPALSPGPVLACNSLIQHKIHESGVGFLRDTSLDCRPFPWAL